MEDVLAAFNPYIVSITLEGKIHDLNFQAHVRRLRVLLT